MADYYNVTTNTGDAEIAAAIASNTKLAITHIAFGDGNGAVPTPSKTRTTLVREVHRQAVTKYERHPTNANWIVIETIIPSNIGGFWVREMGVIANGKMISHGSHAPFEKVADPTGVSEYRLKFTQNIKDGNVVNITLDQSLIYASQAWTDENYVPRDEIIDNLTTDDALKPVSAKQAKNLQDNKLGKTENAVSASKLIADDVRLLKPPLLPSGAITAWFSCFDLLGNNNQGPFADTITLDTYKDNTGGFKNALAFSKNAQAIRHYQAEYGATEWGIVKTIAYAEDVLSKSGGTLTGPLTVNHPITVYMSDADGAFQKLIQGNTSTDGGYVAVGNNGSDKGYLELGTTDAADTAIYARKRRSSDNAIFQEAAILDPYGNTWFPGEITAKSLGIKSVEGVGAGLSLYGGAVDGLPPYGISFAKTFNFGGHGYVTSDWATYFTTTGGNNRGWIFRSGDNGNVASINAQGLLSIHTMKMEVSNFQIEHHSTFSIYYDFATRIVRIVMKVMSAVGVGYSTSPFKVVEGRRTATFALPITLQVRLSAEFTFQQVGLPGYKLWDAEAGEWHAWCAPPGHRGSTESAVTVDVVKWRGSEGEAVDGYLTVVGFF